MEADYEKIGDDFMCLSEEERAEILKAQHAKQEAEFWERWNAMTDEERRAARADHFRTHAEDVTWEKKPSRFS